MKKTIQDIERMVLLYMEEEIFEFEQALVKSNKGHSTNSEIMSQLFGYEAYLSCLSPSEDEDGIISDYTYLHDEIDTFLIRYDKCSLNDIDRDSGYYKMLESRIATGKFDAIKQMYLMSLNKDSYSYKLLDCEIDSFNISHGFTQYNNYRRWAKEANTMILITAVEEYNKDRSKNRIRSVHALVNDEAFYNSLKLVPTSKDGNDYPKPSTLNNYYSAVINKDSQS